MSPKTQSALPSQLTSGVTRLELANGLKVIIKESRSSPVAALLVSVRAGYFNEPDRVSGIAHVVEHMIFKGTPQRPEDEQFAREIREIGGTLNAATYYEETYYYVIVPAENIEKAIEIQADALQNALYDQGELAKELEVIVQESLMKRDNPIAILYETLYEIAFDAHRIRRWRIGLPESLRELKHGDLVEFVQHHYRPENMCVTLVGDFSTKNALAYLEKFWGSYAKGEVKRELSLVEPERTGFRFHRMTGDTKQRLTLTVFPAPPILHPDAAPLMVLSSILSDGRSSRLFRKLKEELQIATSSWASYESFEQMGVFKLGGECRDDDPIEVEKALWSELQEVAKNGVSKAELERVVTRMEMGRLTGQEEVFGVARTLTSYENLGGYELADVLPQRIKEVTSEDIQRVINAWLNLEKASTLEYLPGDVALPERTREETEAILNEVKTNLASSIFKVDTSHISASIQPEKSSEASVAKGDNQEPPKKIEIEGGGTLVYKYRDDLPLVAVQAGFRGGKRSENSSVAGFTNLMLKTSIKGSAALSAQEIANQIEALGSGIGFAASPDSFGYGFKIQKDRLTEGFEIFREVVVRPIFPEEEIDREKHAIYADIRRQQDNSASLAFDLFNAACFGDHPYGLPGNGIQESVEALTQEDLISWHAHFVTAANLTIAILGDLSENEALRLSESLFDNSQPNKVNARVQRLISTEILPPVLMPSDSGTLKRDKKQTASAWGFLGAKYADKDRVALDVLNEITSAMGGRFFRAVRGDNSLAYSVTSVHRSREQAGVYVTYASTAPENEEEARVILKTECARLCSEPVSELELRTAKATLIGEEAIGSQTFSSQAAELAFNGVFNLPLDETRRYLEEVSKITVEQVRQVAQKYLTPEKAWLGVVRGG